MNTAIYVQQNTESIVAKLKEKFPNTDLQKYEQIITERVAQYFLFDEGDWKNMDSESKQDLYVSSAEEEKIIEELEVEIFNDSIEGA